MQAVGQSSNLSADQQTFLRGFLERCDLAKFAGIQPTAEACQNLAAEARKFVIETTPTSQVTQVS